MSFNRYVYWCALGAGWAAFLAWLVLERPIVYFDALGETAAAMRAWRVAGAALTAAVLGGAVGAALGLVGGASLGQWSRRIRIAAWGLAAGGVGGLVGGLAGGVLHTCLKGPQALGWTAMGLLIGAAQGALERSGRKTRNGLIGGAAGGLVGGLLFGLLARPDADAALRAAGFVVLGASVGAMIGLVQVVLKEAWLTVVDGFRPGRQMVLVQSVTVLGRGDHLAMPFLGYSGKELESEHATITRQPDGRYVLEDNRSRLGTRLNGQLVRGPAVLSDGDLIKLGTNIVRFNQRDGGASAPSAHGPEGITPGLAPPPAPGPPPAPRGAGPPPLSDLPGGAVAGRPAGHQTPTPPAARPGPVPRIPPPPPPPT